MKLLAFLGCAVLVVTRLHTALQTQVIIDFQAAFSTNEISLSHSMLINVCMCMHLPLIAGIAMCVCS